MVKIHKKMEVCNNLQKLDDIADIVSGQSPEGGDLRSEQSKDFEFHQGCTFFSSSIINKSDIYISKKTSKKIAIKNSILMSVRAPVGDLNFTDRDISIGRGLISINSKNTQNKFLYFSLLNSKSEIKKLGQGAIFDGLKVSELKTLNIYYPTLKEQKSIASILSKQESIINNLEKVIYNKEKILKEFSHRLLSGEIRLKDENGTISMYKNADDNWKSEKVNGKDVNIPKDWDVLLLKDNLSIINGFAFKTEDMEDYKDASSIPIIKISNIENNKVIILNTHEQKYFNKKILAKYIVNKNDIVVALSGALAGKSGVNYLKETIVLNQRNCILRVNSVNIEQKFLNFLWLNNGLTLLSEKLKSAVIPNLSPDEIKSFSIFSPDVLEQKLIADYLSKQETSIETLKKLLVKEKKKFDFLLDNLLSGKYLVENTEEEEK